MRKLILAIAVLCTCKNSFSQFAVSDKWYNNPLGFEPIKSHTSMGFILPAAAVGACVLLSKKDSLLQSKLSYYSESSFGWGYKYPYTFLPQVNTGINYQLRKFMSVGAEIDLYFPNDKFNKTTGIAIRPFARFYPINKSKYRLYFESGGGLVYFFQNFPTATDKDERTGTKLNGTTKYGIGSEFNFNKQTSIMIGVRHLHISNGNTKGVERNPSHDSNGFFVGLSRIIH